MRGSRVIQPPMRPHVQREWDGFTRAHFLEPSDESTLTWGDSAPIQFSLPASSTPVTFQTPQLVHVARHRPTSYNILLNLDLGMWPLADVGWNLVFNAYVGVGQAKTNFQKIFPFLATAPANTPAYISQIFQLPATAFQCGASLVGTVATAGAHSAQVTILSAPVFA